MSEDKQFATGGWIPAPSRSGDSVPALLSEGSYWIPDRCHPLRPAFRCGTHSRRVPPQDHSAVALVYSHDGRYFHPVCESTLNNWLDNADDDPDLEPHDIVWLNGQGTHPMTEVS